MPDRPAPLRRRVHVLLFVVLLLPYVYFNHSDGWNQASRLALLHALTIDGTVAIDRYHATTGDKALVDGHYYSEKAPAVSALALPAFSLTVFVQRLLGVDPDAPAAWDVSQWIATAGSVGLIVALGGVAFFSLLRHWMSDGLALVATAGVWLGTLVFPYATALFSHGATAGLLTISLWGVLTPAASRSHDYIAGLCAGLAVASEYPAALSVACLAAYVVVQHRERAWRFLLLLLPGLALVALNNQMVTGSPFRLAYGSNPTFPTEGAAHAFGHVLPALDVAGSLLLGQYRGLLFWSPILILAIPGVAVLSRTQRAVAVLVVATVAVCLLQVASFHHWHGGFAVGPRYLLIALPAMAVAAAFGLAKFPKIGAGVAAVSILLMMAVTAVGISPAEDLMTPLRDYYATRIARSGFAQNLGTLAGLRYYQSFAVLALLMGVVGAMLVRELSRGRSVAR